MFEWNQIAFLILGSFIGAFAVYSYFDKKYLEKMEVLKKKVNLHAEKLKTQYQEVTDQNQKLYSETVEQLEKQISEFQNKLSLADIEIQKMQNHKNSQQNIIEKKGIYYTSVLQSYRFEFDKIQKGMETWSELILSFQQFRNYFSKTNEYIEALDENSQQTRILAFNASVEAARAGEVGKSFGQIAVGMQDLAGASSENAKNMNDVLIKIQKEIQLVKNKIEEKSKVTLNEVDSLAKKLHVDLESNKNHLNAA